MIDFSWNESILYESIERYHIKFEYQGCQKHAQFISVTKCHFADLSAYGAFFVSGLILW